MPPGELAFHRLTFVPESGQVLIGRPDTDAYALFPEDGAALLQQLMAGLPVEEAAAWYTAVYDEPVDLEDFLTTLAELGFLRWEGEPQPSAEAPPVRFRQLGHAVFSPWAWACYGLLAAVCTALLVRMPEIRPHPRALFFTDSLLIVQLGLLLAQLPFVFLHEAFHALAGRRIGLPSRLGIGRRLYFVVFETSMNGLLGVPKRKRYLPFLAGMLCDTLVFCALVVVAAVDAGSDGNLSFTGRFAIALAFTTGMRFVWQFYLFLQTDLYYVFSTALGCVDLHDATRAVIRNTAARLLRMPHRTVDQEQWSDRDRAVARWYAPFAAGGVLVLIVTAVGTAVPITVHFVDLLAGRLAHPSHPDGDFWDTVGFLVLSVIQFGLAGVVALRDRARARRAAARPVAQAPDVAALTAAERPYPETRAM